MNKEATLFFFDIDSTTYINAIHDNPESTKVAFRKLKEQGKKLFICTSRSYEEMCMLPKDFLEVMDGIICLMGAHIIINNDETFEVMDDNVRDCLAYLDEQDIVYRYVCANGHGYLNKHAADKEEIFNRLYKMVPPIKSYENEDILHILCYPKTDEQKKYLDENYKNFLITKFSFSTELTCKGIDKGTAIKKVCDLLKVDTDESVAFGDGNNDIPMMEMAGIGIAMGNASDGCKAASDYVTNNIEEDGLYNACVHFGWI